MTGSAAPVAAAPGERAAAATLLVLAARDGDRRAWDELVRRFTPLLWAVARGHRLSREDAADAVQMTWLRCVERLNQVREPGSVAAWLMTICHRECMVVLRQAARAGSLGMRDQAEVLAAVPDGRIREPADAVVELDERAVLREAISRLPDRPRQILVALLDSDEGSGDWYRAVAERLDIPVGSVGPTRQRALRRLRLDPQLHDLRGH